MTRSTGLHIDAFYRLQILHACMHGLRTYGRGAEHSYLVSIKVDDKKNSEECILITNLHMQDAVARPFVNAYGSDLHSFDNLYIYIIMVSRCRRPGPCGSPSRP